MVKKFTRFDMARSQSRCSSGIAVIIFASQFKDLLGLQVEHVPAEFVAKIAMLARHAGEFNPWALAIAGGSAAVIFAVRRWAAFSSAFWLR